MMKYLQAFSLAVSLLSFIAEMKREGGDKESAFLGLGELIARAAGAKEAFEGLGLELVVGRIAHVPDLTAELPRRTPYDVLAAQAEGGCLGVAARADERELGGSFLRRRGWWWRGWWWRGSRRRRLWRRGRRLRQ